MAENPRVTSKFDRMGGKPRAVHPVSTPGGTTTPSGMQGAGEREERSPAPSRSTTEDGHRQTTYHPTEHGRMDRGERSVHPTHGQGGAEDDSPEDE